MATQWTDSQSNGYSTNVRPERCRPQSWSTSRIPTCVDEAGPAGTPTRRASGVRHTAVIGAALTRLLRVLGESRTSVRSVVNQWARATSRPLGPHRLGGGAHRKVPGAAPSGGGGAHRKVPGAAPSGGGAHRKVPGGLLSSGDGVDSGSRYQLFAPARRPRLVARPRVAERLGTTLDAGNRLTLVSAPAGFGKTTLLSDWLADLDQRQRQTRVGWLSLDDGDNDLTRFVVHLVAALQSAELDVDAAVLESLSTASAAAALTALVNDSLAPVNRSRGGSGSWCSTTTTRSELPRSTRR